jgi:hypothetical protein
MRPVVLAAAATVVATDVNTLPPTYTLPETVRSPWTIGFTRVGVSIPTDPVRSTAPLAEMFGSEDVPTVDVIETTVAVPETFRSPETATSTSVALALESAATSALSATMLSTLKLSAVREPVAVRLETCTGLVVRISDA